MENMEGDLKSNRQLITKIKKDLMAGKKPVKADYEMRKIKNKKSKDFSFSESYN